MKLQNHIDIEKWWKDMKKILKRTFIAVICFCMLMSNFALFAKAASVNKPSDKLLAITFDDGPSKYTYWLLDRLKERNVKATFFIVGSRANTYFDVIERMYDEGHQIAGHTFNHTYLTKVSGETVRDEVEKTRIYLAAAGGDRTYYVRCPGGLMNSTVKSNINAPIISWSVDPEDWKYKDAERVKNHIVSAAKDGDIILVHDLYKTSVEGAVEAIDILIEQGYEFVTVEELLYRRGITPQNGTVYSSAPNKGTNLPAKEDSTLYTKPLVTHPYYNAIQKLLDQKVYTLDAGGEFAPEKAITKGMFATMLGRLSGVRPNYNSETGCSDVPSNLYQAPFIEWGLENNIFNKNPDGTFGISETITREQMITYLTRYLALRGVEMSSYKPPSYQDQSIISAWAKESVDFCKYAGIIRNAETTNFDAQKIVTKAEACEYICRVNEIINDPQKYIEENGQKEEEVKEHVEDIKTRQRSFSSGLFKLIRKIFLKIASIF